MFAEQHQLDAWEYAKKIVEKGFSNETVALSDAFIEGMKYLSEQTRPEFKRLETRIKELEAGIIELEKLRRYHIAPYNLGEEGRIHDLILRLSQSINQESNTGR